MGGAAPSRRHSHLYDERPGRVSTGTKRTETDGASRARTGDLLAASQTLSQLSYGPRDARSLPPTTARLGGDCGLDLDRRHVAPELLEAVEATHLGREEMEDDVEVVGHDPVRLANPSG